eukprot:90937-Lingulodinium_polyedra.AAC.1
MGTDGLQWMPLDSIGFHGTPMDSCGAQWTPLHPRGLRWTPMASKSGGPLWAAGCWLLADG